MCAEGGFTATGMAPGAKCHLIVLVFDFTLVQFQFASERKADLGQLGAISETNKQKISYIIKHVRISSCD